MSLYRMLTNELLNVKLVEISKDDVNELHKYVNSIRGWCPSISIEVCTEFIKVLDDVSDLLSRLRLAKAALHGEVPERSVDSGFLLVITDLVRHYYRLLLHGLVDSSGNVYVRVVRDVSLGGVTHQRGVMTSVPVVEALLLSKLGYVEVMDKIIKRK